jgi:hypothetical protein
MPVPATAPMIASAVTPGASSTDMRPDRGLQHGHFVGAVHAGDFERGDTSLVCHRGLGDADVVEGAAKSTMEELASETLAADRTVVF